jgi:hypothetical protein
MLDVCCPEISHLEDRSDERGGTFMSRIDPDGVRRIQIPERVFRNLIKNPNCGEWRRLHENLIRQISSP